MALFVLREGFRVETTATGGRVVHNRTGDALQLSPLEVQVLARATAWGINPRDPELRPVIRKLSGLGLLKPAAGEPAVDVDLDFDAPEASAPAAPAAAPGAPPVAAEPAFAAAPFPAVETIPASAPFAVHGAASAPAPPASTPASAPKPSNDDLVPLFRGELQVTRKGNTSLYEVSDLTAGRSFTLYDFELSLARMLTGKRRYREVVEIGERLGIPVNLESLTQFVRQLERYGFLAPAGTQPPEPQEGSVWAPREKWDEQLRTLFQSGLKMSRQGRYGEAAGYFEAMLQQDPDNPEALEMLAQVQQRLSSDPGLAVVTPSFPEFPGETLSPSDLGLGSAAAPVPPPAQPQAPSQQAAGKARRRLTAPLAAALAGVAVVGVAAGAWLGLRDSKTNEPLEVPAVSAEQTPRPAPATPPKAAPAPGPATDRAALAPPPQAPATAGSTEQPPPATEEPKGEVAAAPAADPVPPAPPAPALAPAPTPAQAAAAPAPAPAPAENAVIAVLTKRGRVTMAEISAPAAGVVTWKVEPQQLVRRGQVVGTLLAGTKKRPLSPKQSGLLMPKVSHQEKAGRGELLAEVVYPEAYMQALVDGSRPLPGWGCDVVDQATGNTASCKIVTVEPRGARFHVTATTEPLWFDTAAQPRLRLTPK